MAEKIKNLKVALSNLNKAMEVAEAENNIATISEIKYIEIPAVKKALEENQKRLINLQKRRTVEKQEVGKEEVARVVSSQTGIPLEKMVASEIKKLSTIEKFLSEKIIGQDVAIKKVSEAIKRARVGLSDPERPTGSFLFMGPTGVGKTELTKKLAEFLFDDQEALIRVDMSELMESHSVSKLLGSPPGYVGHEEGGSLTEKIRHRPYSIVLFDEIEKAHPDIFNILLQVLDNGRLTDSKGRIVDFKNTVVILTSNIGSEFVEKMNTIGFALDSKKENRETKKEYEEKKSESLESLKRYFKPEFLNRLDDIILFESLSEKSLEKIAKMELEKISQRMAERGVKINLTKRAEKALINDEYPAEYGARPIKRIIQEKILSPLSDKMLENYDQPGAFNIDFKDKNFVFSFKPGLKNKGRKSSLKTNKKVLNKKA
jgi:ATP-dependent Clp protease ATP-binding subunit ClpA